MPLPPALTAARAPRASWPRLSTPSSAAGGKKLPRQSRPRPSRPSAQQRLVPITSSTISGTPQRQISAQKRSPPALLLACPINTLYQARELAGNSRLLDLRNNAEDLHVNYGNYVAK